ncbi:MAG: hypothetical protein V1871_06655 [Planctomycetota bacterium]
MAKDDEGVDSPPGWKTWDAAKQRDWEHGLERAKNAIKRHGQEKVESALRPLDAMARKGVPLEDAQNAAITLLDRGAVLSDFEPLGKFVVAKNQQGLKGKDLIEVITQEIKRLKTEREELEKKIKDKKDTGTPPDPLRGETQESSPVREKDKDKPKEKAIEYPPGWATWDKVKQQDWERGLELAKDAVKKHEQDKVESVLCTLDTMAIKGVLLEDAQNVVITLLDQGADSSDYYPLYVFIIGKNQEGIKGKELIEDIILEIKRLKDRHEELLKKAKEKKDAGPPPEKDKPEEKTK